MSASTAAEGRFWVKVDTSGDCWIWTAARQPTGYGRERKRAMREAGRAAR